MIKKQCYEGGIFTDCKTSCNQEIWERILKITKLYYKDQYNPNIDLETWSWPGSIPSPFTYEKDGMKYYDSGFSIPYNYLARFLSSITGENRSWTECLRNAGYTITHDTVYPSKDDGLYRPMMSKQFIYNASLSRRDALPYSTNRTISYINIANDYPISFFNNSGKSKASQMYDHGGEFLKFIEAIRHDTSNGIIHGEVIDSANTYSENVFLTQMLEYCKVTGVEVIPKNQAYDICFNYVIDKGNLIYNPTFRNTAKEFMPDADNIPSNPDGYIGSCYVISNNDTNTLVTKGVTEYLHCGIPIGDIYYSADIRGSGNIQIYAIKNSDDIECNYNALILLSACNISSNDFKNYQMNFKILDNPESEYDYLCEGLGDKIMAIKIVYSDGLEIKNIQLEKR